MSRQAEQSLQEAIVIEIGLKYGNTILYCASAGGMRTSKHVGAKMKRAGYKKGFPDLFFYEPRGDYKGLAIELKTKKDEKTGIGRTGTASKEQKEWIAELERRGYRALVTKGYDETMKAIHDYMNLKPSY